MRDSRRADPELARYLRLRRAAVMANDDVEHALLPVAATGDSAAGALARIAQLGLERQLGLRGRQPPDA